MIERETRFHRLGGIILADDQLAAALVAHALLFRGHRGDVVARAALGADAPPAHALHDGLVRDLHGDHMVEADAVLLQRLRLADRARHTVEDVAVRTVRLGETVADDADDDLIGNQRSGLHAGLRLHAQLAAARNRGAQDVAGGNRRNVQLTGEDRGLRALSRAGSAQ